MPVILDTEFDFGQGSILEGALALPPEESAERPGFYIETKTAEDAAILVGSGGVTEMGGTDMNGCAFTAEIRVDREAQFPSECSFRLLLRHDLIEFYLDDLFIHAYSISSWSTGKIGLFYPESIKDLKGWTMTLPPSKLLHV